METLLADDLPDQLRSIGHDLVTQDRICCPSPDILGEVPLHYFIDEVVLFLAFGPKIFREVASDGGTGAG